MMVKQIAIGSAAGAVGIMVARKFTVPAVAARIPGSEGTRQFIVDAIVALHGTVAYVMGSQLAGQLPKSTAQQVVGAR